MSQSPASTLRSGVVGMGWFIVSDAAMFAALIVVCRLLAEPGGRVPSFDGMTAAQTGLLVIASGVVTRFRGTRWSAAVVAVLGTAFCAVTALEYRGIASTFSATDSVAAAGFFAVTGFHAVHVAVGAIAAALSMRSGLSRPLVIYWNFVDTAWLVIVVTIYL